MFCRLLGQTGACVLHSKGEWGYSKGGGFRCINIFSQHLRASWSSSAIFLICGTIGTFGSSIFLQPPPKKKSTHTVTKTFWKWYQDVSRETHQKTVTRNAHEAGRLRLRGDGRCQGDTFTAFVRPGVVSIRAIATFSKCKIDTKIRAGGLGKARKLWMHIALHDVRTNTMV